MEELDALKQREQELKEQLEHDLRKLEEWKEHEAKRERNISS